MSVSIGARLTLHPDNKDVHRLAPQRSEFLAGALQWRDSMEKFNGIRNDADKQIISSDIELQCAKKFLRGKFLNEIAVAHLLQTP